MIDFWFRTKVAGGWMLFALAFAGAMLGVALWNKSWARHWELEVIGLRNELHERKLCPIQTVGLDVMVRLAEPGHPDTGYWYGPLTTGSEVWAGNQQLVDVKEAKAKEVSRTEDGAWKGDKK